MYALIMQRSIARDGSMRYLVRENNKLGRIVAKFKTEAEAVAFMNSNDPQ